MIPATFEPGDAVDVRFETRAGPVWRPGQVMGYAGANSQRLDVEFDDGGVRYGCDPSSVRPRDAVPLYVRADELRDLRDREPDPDHMLALDAALARVEREIERKANQ